MDMQKITNIFYILYFIIINVIDQSFRYSYIIIPIFQIICFNSNNILNINSYNIIHKWVAQILFKKIRIIHQ